VTVQLTGETVVIMVTPGSDTEPSFYQRWLRARLDAANIKVETRTPEEMASGIEPQWIVLDDIGVHAAIRDVIKVDAFTKEFFDREIPVFIDAIKNESARRDHIKRLRGTRRSKGKQRDW
jgi:hypothetical protein